MGYSITALSKLAGISTRTLRFYDQIGLLSPKRSDDNNYRVYTQTEVDLLQQIMFFRELKVPLLQIKQIMLTSDYEVTKSLEKHINQLEKKREQLDKLIAIAKKTISTMKGEGSMSDKEKFDGFKKKMIEENERKYGKEIRQKYSNDEIDASNAKLMNMTKEQYDEVTQLSNQINSLLKIAFEEGDPSSETAQKVCELHKKWLCYYWKSYSKEAHKNIAQTYVDDYRFRRYYDDIKYGCAEFLYRAIMIYCN